MLHGSCWPQLSRRTRATMQRPPHTRMQVWPKRFLCASSWAQAAASSLRWCSRLSPAAWGVDACGRAAAVSAVVGAMLQCTTSRPAVHVPSSLHAYAGCCWARSLPWASRTASRSPRATSWWRASPTRTPLRWDLAALAGASSAGCS